MPLSPHVIAALEAEGLEVNEDRIERSGFDSVEREAIAKHYPWSDEGKDWKPVAPRRPQR